MKRMSVGVVISVIMMTVLQAHGRPATRYDATNQTCRVLSDGPLEWDSQPWGEGGRIFKTTCKECHSRGNDKGAPFLWPESKNSQGWNRVFVSRYPKCAQDGSWDGLDKEQLRKLNDYLYRWAASSADPNDSC